MKDQNQNEHDSDDAQEYLTASIKSEPAMMPECLEPAEESKRGVMEFVVRVTATNDCKSDCPVPNVRQRAMRAFKRRRIRKLTSRQKVTPQQLFVDNSIGLDVHQNDEKNHVLNRMIARSPAESLMVTWILENFEPSEGSSLKRSVLYDFYREHCVSKEMEPINPASFGKLIRSVFVGIKTRRLGTRGNSKYHYYGVKVTDSSPLKHRLELENNEMMTAATSNNAQPFNHRQRAKTEGTVAKSEPMYFDGYDGVTDAHFPPSLPPLPLNMQAPPHSEVYYEDMFRPGDETAKFLLAYKSHLQLITNAVSDKQFASLEFILNGFWQPQQCSEGVVHQPLSPDQLASVLSSRTVIKTIKLMERRNNLVICRRLIPDLAMPMIEEWRRIVHSFIRDFTEWTRLAIFATPSELKIMKAHTMFHLCALVEDRLQANLLLHCFSVSIQTQETLLEMSRAFESINRHTIGTLVEWCTEQDDTFSANMDAVLMTFLSGRQSLDRCIHSLLSYANAFVNRYNVLEGDQVKRAARMVVGNWNLYSSTVLRFLYIQKADHFERFNALLTALGNCVTQEMMFRHEMISAAAANELNYQHPVFFQQQQQQANQPIIYHPSQRTLNNNQPAIKRQRFAE